MHSALLTLSRRAATRPDPTSARTIRRALAALLLAGGVLLGLGSTAYAHDSLTDSRPADGDTLDDPPTQVRLTFSAEVLELGAAVVVADSDGDTWEAGEPAVDGTDVTVPLEDGLPNGTYEISWRVTSSDGHPISGVIPFTVDAPATDTASPEESAPAESAPTTAPPAAKETSELAPTTSEPAPTTTAPTAEEPAAASESETTSGGFPWLPIAIGVLVALIAYAVVRVVRRGAPNGDSR